MKKLLIPYVMGNAKLLQNLHVLEKAGADFIEIGLPFSDPVADGETILQAGQAAIKEGMTTKKIFELLTAHQGEFKTPYLLMTYYQLIEAYGVAEFVQAAERANVYGLIIPDLPFELGERFKAQYLKGSRLKLISLIAMTTSQQRMQTIAKKAEGFIYTVTMNAITGDNLGGFHQTLAEKVARIKAHASVPVVCGFGIRSVEDVRNIATFSDGVVIGSELVKRFANDSAQAVNEYLQEVRAQLDAL
ncbi:tryptophan synthase subunit alpha [Rappaport israeli]|uniref:tryptophan synthase subunit alpha n=1 Tax=Rappaport israeli TaxID=1839807 RepID=UPI000931F3D9|nr:tryptophan synthase subunit alpha [Rappaport israeli]